MTRLQTLLEADARYSARLRRAAILLAHSGDSWFWGLGLGLAYWLGDPAWRPAAVSLFAAIVANALVVQIIKRIIKRQRPKGQWGAIYRSTDPHSFPSGHAARMVMLAALGLAYGPPWLGGLLVIWAPLVALARVGMGVHYLSDVVVGAALGIVFGILWAVFWVVRT